MSVGQIHMYEDDTTAFCIWNSIEEVTTKKYIMLRELSMQHKLKLHYGKTKALMLNRYKFVGPLNELRVGQNSIEYANETECLEIKFDPKLLGSPDK